MGSEQIEKNRKKLNEITRNLVKLIGERNKTVVEIGKIKKKFGLPVVDLKREKKVVENSVKIAKKFKVDEKVVKRIMRILINYARKIQR